MQTLVKGTISSVIIAFAMVGFTGLSSESDGEILSNQGNSRPQLSNYIDAIKSQSSVAFSLTELETCETVIKTTLPFQSDYKNCESSVKATYAKLSVL